MSCAVDRNDMEGPRLYAYVYFTGSGIINGHSWTSLYSDVHSTAPVGSAIPAGGTLAHTPVMEAADLTFSRQSSTLMAVSNGKLTQFTLHLFADGRDLDGKPCTLWGTAV